MKIIANISKSTLVWSLFIITSAFYMRQILNFLYNNIGRTGVGLLLIILFSLAGLFIIRLFFNNTLSVNKIVLIVIILSAGFYYALKINILEEKIHLIKYGILGWLSIKDFLKLNNAIYMKMIISLLFCLMIVLIDEGIQWFLPWRVGDIRDVGFAVIGGLWGIMLYILTRPGRNA